MPTTTSSRRRREFTTSASRRSVHWHKFTVTRVHDDQFIGTNSQQRPVHRQFTTMSAMPTSSLAQAHRFDKACVAAASLDIKVELNILAVVIMDKNEMYISLDYCGDCPWLTQQRMTLLSSTEETIMKLKWAWETNEVSPGKPSCPGCWQHRGKYYPYRKGNQYYRKHESEFLIT